MNELVRIALVINTNHSKFITNLLNVVIYVLDASNKQLSIEEIQDYIEKNIFLVFTRKELKDAIKEAIKAQYVIEIDKDMFVLDEKGNEIVRKGADKSFSNIISRYIKEYELIFSQSELESLIYKFIYDALNGNINIIMDLLQKKQNRNLINSNVSDYTDEEKKIINEFLEWEDPEKDEVLYKIISFSVDYCRMTVKQNSSSFKNFFIGKKFFLDANIFYRLLGINNEERERTVTKFIEKCNLVGVKLYYSNYTKEEVFDSLKYNVTKLKKALSRISASPDKIEIVLGDGADIGLYKVYHKWALNCNGFGEFDDFIDHLKNEFYSIVCRYNITNYTFEDMSNKISDYKKAIEELGELKGVSLNSDRKKVVEIDAQNVLNIRKIRGINKNGNAWNINHFLISADHNLIKWSDDRYSNEIPIVILPSVWYSMMLKLCGRTGDDYKSYIQFMKIRYSEVRSNNAFSVLYNISQISDNRIIQDKIIDNLVNNNKLETMNLLEEDEISRSVNQAYENVLADTEHKGFINGVEEGRKHGFKDGNNNGLVLGIEIGKLNAGLERIEEKINNKKKIIRIRNFILNILPYIVIVCFLLVQHKYKIIDTIAFDDIATYITVAAMFLPCTIGNIFSFVKKKYLPVDNNVIEAKIRKQYQSKIDKIQSKLNSLNRDVSHYDCK